ncbi:MAG: ORF6N domain-containing protein [Burkholderiales bacterium]
MTVKSRHCERSAAIHGLCLNLARFRQDFMFQLSADEFTALRSQTVTSNTGRGGRRL